VAAVVGEVLDGLFRCFGRNSAIAQGDAGTRSNAPPGSLGALVKDYFNSGSFRQYDEATQRDKRGVLESVLREPLEIGKPLLFEVCPVKSLNRKLDRASA
jgi:hypothetical protein